MNEAPAILLLHPAGESEGAEALGDRLGAHRGRELSPGGGTGAARIAEALTAAERVISEEGPDAVVLCGSGPEAGAAALAAAKLGVPLARVSAAPPDPDHEPAALADLDTTVAERLADLVVPAGTDSQRAADAIQTWLATYTPTP